MSEETALLSSPDHGEYGSTELTTKPAAPFNTTIRSVVWGILTVLTIAILVIMLFFRDDLPDSLQSWVGGTVKDPMFAALSIMDKSPIIVCLSALFGCKCFIHLPVGWSY